jgi:hypothetical protein
MYERYEDGRLTIIFPESSPTPPYKAVDASETPAPSPNRRISVAASRRARWLRSNPGPPWFCIRCEKPIWHLGTSADSLNLHHPNRDHENWDAEVEPYHHKCHMTEHARIKRERERIERRR